VADEIILKSELLSKDKAEVHLCEKLIDEAVILANELIQDVLENGSNFSEGEHIVLS
jgi:hypothetical protein